MTKTNLTQELKELRERNEKRLQEAKEKLGAKWLLHPDNQVQSKLKQNAKA